MKTSGTYESDIKNWFSSNEKPGELKGNLYKFTRSNVRTACLNLVDEGLDIEDEKVMKYFFGITEAEDLRNKIKNYDIDGFRPICKFLKNETETIKQFDALELIAILTDFTPRPYHKYRSEDRIIHEEEEETLKDLEMASADERVTYITDPDNQKTKITVSLKDKKLFAWFTTASATGKIAWAFGISFVFFVSIMTMIYFSNDEPNWMIWNNDHYIEVKLDTDTYEFNQLKRYKEERILYFRKIIPNCDTKFFNEDGSENLWYGKNAKKELEYFTDIGLHPETGTSLKKITPYMIRTHICPSYE